MTKIHPEARMLLEKAQKAGIPTVYMGQEHYKSQDAERALSQALFERDEARVKAMEIALNHAALADERDALRAQVAEMREALTSYANDFCECSEGHEICGKLGKEDCSGCLAQSLLRKAIKDNSND